MTSTLLRIIAAFSLIAATMAAGAQSVNGAPSKLLQSFDRGVNVTRWFCYQQNYTKDHLENYLVAEDYATFKRLHVHFVRLCIAPEAIYQATLPYLDKALSKLTGAGLAVIVDLHDNGQLHLDASGHDNSGFLSFWRAVAAHYKGRYEDRILFELVNEPQFQHNKQVWYDLQEKAVAAVRSVDHRRTIMVSGNLWSGIEALLDLPILPEKNLVYTFHCYDPFLFTHEGASWVGDPPSGLKSMPFPSSSEAVAAMIGQISDHDKGAVEDYGRQRFNDAYLDGRMDKPMAWARSHHVPAVLGEFGSYPPVAPVQSRERWFRGMRDAMEAHAVPNCIWGYDDAMGLGRRLNRDGTLWLDPVTLASFYGVGSG